MIVAAAAAAVGAGAALEPVDSLDMTPVQVSVATAMAIGDTFLGDNHFHQ